jgi:FMN phosphatase YigB (HAD superfamily)/carbamoylphosphate synthase large subunit
MKTALLVSGGGFQGLTLIRALQELPDVRVIVCDLYPENIARYICHDYVVVPPLSDADAFTRALLEIVDREKVDVVFPSTALELMALSQLKAKLQAHGAQVAVSDEKLLGQLLDKQSTHAFLCAAGLPVPPLVDPLAFDYALPLFGRPRHGWGGRETILLHSADEARGYHSELSTHVWTPWLAQFEEFSADFAIGVNGDVSPIVLRRRLRTSGGFAVISESVADATLAEMAQRTAGCISHAGGCGLFNVQMLRPTTGRPFISDVNPRIGTSATHALTEGVNLPGFFMDCPVASVDAGPTIHRMGKTIRVLKDIAVPHLAQPPKGIVFDLDDTLVDHKLWMLRKLEAIYAETFSRHVDEAAFLMGAAQLIDEGERALLIDRLLATLSLPATLRDSAIAAYRAAIVTDTPLFADVAPTLAAFKAAGLPVAILTDNPPATQKAKLQHAPALHGVNAVVYAREHGIEKPAPTGFLQAARALNIDPRQLVMIGDNYFRDGIGAVQAGYMHALIVRREGGFLSPHAGIAARVATQTNNRIHMVDSLLSACHACRAL